MLLASYPPMPIIFNWSLFGAPFKKWMTHTHGIQKLSVGNILPLQTANNLRTDVTATVPGVCVQSNLALPLLKLDGYASLPWLLAILCIPHARTHGAVSDSR